MPRRRRAAVPNAGQIDFASLLFADAAASPDAVREVTVAPAAQPEPSHNSSKTFFALVPIYSVKLVRMDTLAMRERIKINGPHDAVALLQKYLHGVDREHFVIVMLDTKGQVIGISTVSIGDISSAIVHPREVFKPAILASAASILLGHNHPSGDPTPSPEDAAVTRRLCEVGELLGIEVVDHVVIGDPGRFVSLKEKGLCP